MAELSRNDTAYSNKFTTAEGDTLSSTKQYNSSLAKTTVAMDSAGVIARTHNANGDQENRIIEVDYFGNVIADEKILFFDPYWKCSDFAHLDGETWERAYSVRSIEGIVKLTGLARVGSKPLVSGDVVCRIDAAHAPRFESVHLALANNGFVRLHVKKTRDVVLETVTGGATSVDGFISLEGVSFRAGHKLRDTI